MWIEEMKDADPFSSFEMAMVSEYPSLSSSLSILIWLNCP